MNYSFALFYGDVFKFFLEKRMFTDGWLEGDFNKIFFQKIPKPKTEFLLRGRFNSGILPICS